MKTRGLAGNIRYIMQQNEGSGSGAYIMGTALAGTNKLSYVTDASSSYWG